MSVNKRGVMAWDEILGVMLAAGTVLIMLFLLFRLLAPGIDINEEYAEGVFARLEMAAAEAEDGRGEFSIVDVPVDYADSVFLVLFKGADSMILSGYAVEIKNSGFKTYVEKSAVPFVMTSRRAYYRTLVDAGVPEATALGASDEIGEKIALEAVKNVDDILFKNDMRGIVKNFVSETKSGLDADKIIQEVLGSGFEGLPPADKISKLKGVLGSYVSEGGKVGRYQNVDTFMNSAQALAKTNTMDRLGREVGFSLDAEKIIRDAVSDEDVAEALIKEMTDETFGEGLELAAKKSKLTTMLKRNADNVVGIDGVLEKVGKLKVRSGKEVAEALVGSIDNTVGASSDDLLKVATSKILSIKAVPGEKVTKDIVQETLTNKKVGSGVIKKALGLLPKGKIARLGVKIAGKALVAGLIVWEFTEYYDIATDAKAYVLTAFNQEKVSTNDWVSKKLLQVDKGKYDTLCVCYVDDDYRKNRCFDCVSFGKSIVTSPEDKNFWTYCNSIVLEDTDSGIMTLTSTVKEGCISSIALTNVECNESVSALKTVLDTPGNDFIGGVTAVGSSTVYAAVMGALGGAGGCIVGGVFGFVTGAVVGAIPGCGAGIIAGMKVGAVVGAATGAAVGTVVAFKDVKFSCDGQGHIYLGATPEE